MSDGEYPKYLAGPTAAVFAFVNSKGEEDAKLAEWTEPKAPEPKPSKSAPAPAPEPAPEPAPTPVADRPDER